jgi:hypothetical protein
MWFTKPEVIYATVLFLIALLATVYTSATRRLFGLPIKGLKRLALRDFEHELAELKAIHGNSYQFLLWIFWNIFYTARVIFWIWILSALLTAGFIIFKRPLPLIGTLSALPSTAFGAIIGRSQKVYHVLTALYDYDRRTARLKEGIAALRVELGLAPPVTTAQADKTTAAS